MADTLGSLRTNFLTYTEMQSIFPAEEFRPFIEYMQGLISDIAYIARVSDNLQEQITALELRVKQNEIDIAANTDLINYNFQYLHGSPLYADEYDESLSYSALDKVMFDGNEYSAKANIPAPAGVFDPTEWRQVSTQGNHDFINQTRSDSVATFSFASYGGLRLDSAPALFPDIDATWQTINVFDTVSFTTPRNITQNVGNSSLSFGELGVYEIVIYFAVEHNESNGGRETNLRLYNLTDATPTDAVIPLFIARNQPGTNFSLSFTFEVSSQPILNRELVIQIGGGDTLTGVSFDSAAYYIKSIGEFRGEFGTL